MKRFPEGLVFKAHRPLYHSTLGLRVIKKRESGPSGRYSKDAMVLPTLVAVNVKALYPIPLGAACPVEG